MADGTRVKELQEAHRKLDQNFQAEALKRAAVEDKLQEQIQSMNQKMDQKLAGLDKKYDLLSNTLADIKLHLLSMGKEKGISILGSPPKPASSEGSKSHQTSFTSRFKSDFSAHSSSSTTGNSLHRVDFPKFNGSNPRAWILKCSTYFKLTSAMPDENMVQLAIHNFEGNALQWFQNFGCDSVLDITWEQFVDIVAARFGELNEGKIIMEFKNLKQTSSYNDYVEKFQELRACMMLSTNMQYSEEYFIASFISGLTEEMQGFMLLLKPKTLAEAMDVGEKQLFALDAITKRAKPPAKGYQNQGVSYKKTEGVTALKPHNSNNTRTPIKLLTSAEMAARREKGLCYNCDEPFVYGHKCMHKVFYTTMSEEEELEHLQHEDKGMEMVQMGEEEMEEIHMNDVPDNANSRTMRVIGEVGDTKLKILLDTGSTLSFLREGVAKELGIQLDHGRSILVKVANGQRLVSTKVATDFTWEMQGHSFTFSPRILRNDGYDLILGSDWLEFCTPITLDYKNMMFSVFSQGRKVKLRAITDSAHFQMITAQNLYQLIHSHMDEIEEMYLIKHQQNSHHSHQGQDLEQLLEEYQDIFQEPVGLPPEAAAVPAKLRCPAEEFEALGQVFWPVRDPVTELPEIDGEGGFKIAPFCIKEHRVVEKNGVVTPQALVQWSCADDSQVSWEDLKFIRKKFPKFDPCGQGSNSGGGIVMDLLKGESKRKNSSCVEEEKMGVFEMKKKKKVFDLDQEKCEDKTKERVNLDRPRG